MIRPPVPAVQQMPHAKGSMCFKWKWLSRVQLFATPWTVAHQVPLSMGDSPGKNTGVGGHALLQGIFSTQGSNLVSRIAGRFFTVWATREALGGYADVLLYKAISELCWPFL